MPVAAPEPKFNMGEPAPRVDGRDKVTGAACYPSDFPVGSAPYAFLVTSAVALGRITEIDLAEAQSVQGVLAIITHENTAGEIRKIEFFANGGQASESIVALASPQVWHDGQRRSLPPAGCRRGAKSGSMERWRPCVAEGYEWCSGSWALPRRSRPRY